MCENILFVWSVHDHCLLFLIFISAAVLLTGPFCSFGKMSVQLATQRRVQRALSCNVIENSAGFYPVSVFCTPPRTATMRGFWDHTMLYTGVLCLPQRPGNLRCSQVKCFSSLSFRASHVLGFEECFSGNSLIAYWLYIQTGVLWMFAKPHLFLTDIKHVINWNDWRVE